MQKDRKKHLTDSVINTINLIEISEDYSKGMLDLETEPSQAAQDYAVELDTLNRAKEKLLETLEILNAIRGE